MKILAASDIHGESSLAKRLAEKASKENVDLVILCGDNTGSIESKDLIKPFKERNQKVLIVHGNWDNVAISEVLAAQYKIRNIHGYYVIYNNVGFFGAGGVEMMSGDEMFDTIKKAHENMKAEKKIMITHEHPAGSLSELSGIRGSEGIRKAIEELEPDFLLHGHIHEAAGVEEMIGKTKVINVGREGKILEI